MKDLSPITVYSVSCQQIATGTSLPDSWSRISWQQRTILISAHLLHINSPGGEAWYMDRLSETLRNAKKPILAIYEEYCASAAYYIGCHGQKLYATTSHDFVLGCIGTMCSFWNFEPYFEKLGLKKITAKATNSTRKNKVFEDLKDGKTEEYIKNVLDPMNEQFLAEVKAMRPKLSELGDDAPVLQGESFYTDPAEEVGLIDGKRTLLEAIAEVAQMGDAYMAEPEPVWIQLILR